LAWWFVGCGNGADGVPARTAQGAGGEGTGGRALDASSQDEGALGGGGATASDASAEAGAHDDAALGAACSPPLDLDQPIAKLSQTGCVDPRDPTKFAPIAVPYEVNSPLWSDAADKTRAFVLPAGKKIHVKDCAKAPGECSGPADDGKWVFPVGAVMIKNFIFDTKLVETRLFIHANDTTWIGYGYQWNEAQTDATVVGFDRVSVMFNTGRRTVGWHYPSRMDCMTCHNEAGGSTLGPETAQMNRTVSGTNQIDKFQSLGLFESAPTKPYKTGLVTPYAGQLGAPPASAALEQKARSYLHANCGFCHRPGGVLSTFDLRYDVPLKNTATCNVAVTKSATGIDPLTTKLLAPGDPTRSAISIRMAEVDPDSGRMPQIGSYAVDGAAVTLVDDWIRSLSDCPR
jgi:uncharacterized repeat protein (TIGR03806 family)